MAEILQLLASPLHRFEGRPTDGPLPAAGVELVSEIEVHAGLGIVGDRYYAKPAHRDAAVTVIASEALPPGVDLVPTRRNILLGGVDVDALIGRVLTLDQGYGAVELAVRRAARPCAWLDATIAPGARAALLGKSGVRCTPLTSGRLRLGPVHATITRGPAPTS